MIICLCGMSSSISLPFRVICVGLKSLLALPTSPVGVARWSLRVLSCRGGSKIAQLPLVSQSLICTGVWLESDVEAAEAVHGYWVDFWNQARERQPSLSDRVASMLAGLPSSAACSWEPPFRPMSPSHRC